MDVPLNLVTGQVASDDQHTLLLAAPGHVWAFGSNFAGYLATIRRRL